MAHPPLVEHCIELLAPLGSVRARRMFGGHGLYVDDLFCALIASDRLYLKADAGSRPQFESAGCEPFAYQAKDGTHVATGYWSAPAEAMESPALMAPWGRLALRAAVAARALKRPAAKRPAKRAATPASDRGRSRA